jgi:hypothetical protein
MTLRIRDSITVFPWVRVNLNTRSTSVTIGPKGGPHLTINSRGTKTFSIHRRL